MLIRGLTIFAVFLFMSCHFMVVGQDIVSTSPQNKLVILEEFGGMYCVYCPEGHQIVNDLSIAFEDDLILLNYHEGYYSTPLGGHPDLRSDFGDEILLQTGLSGFPGATVNRKNFPGLEQGSSGTTALGRTDWATAIAATLEEPSPVNIAAEATLNIATRELEIYIEYYYTSDAPGETNLLNLAILQNNILAPQHGGGEGNYYPHQYLVRDFLTGQWGHIITNTNEASFGSLTYNLVLPLNYRNTDVDPFNISLAIFIAEGQQNIFTGIKVVPELTSTFENDVSLLAIYAEDDICGNNIDASILVRNDGNQAIESMDIYYNTEGLQQQHLAWTGHLEPLEETTIYLSSASIPNDSGHYDFIVSLIEPNNEIDPTTFNNSKVHNFCVAPRVNMVNYQLSIKTDDFGYELYWEIVDEFDEVLYYGGNSVVGQTNGGEQIAMYNDPNVYGNNQIYVEDIHLPVQGCYRLRVLDDFADGLCCEYGTGFFKLKIPGESPFIAGASFGAIEEHSFVVDFAVTVVGGHTPDITIELFPNPVKQGEEIQMVVGDLAIYQWQIVGLEGKMLLHGDQNSPFKTADLAKGFYVIRIKTDAFYESYPFLIQ